MLLLNGAAVVLFIAGLAVLFVKKFETTLETRVGPVKTPLGISMVIVAMAAFAFPFSPWYKPSATQGPCCVTQSPTAKPSASSTPTPTPSPSPTPTPSPIQAVTLTYPTDNTRVSRSKGFEAHGTAVALGANTLWIADHDPGGYTIDEQATVTNGAWTALDGPLGDPHDSLPFPLTLTVIVANQACAAKLDKLAASEDNDYTVTLPAGCTTVAQATVSVALK